MEQKPVEAGSGWPDQRTQTKSDIKPNNNKDQVNPGTKPDVDAEAVAREQNPHGNPNAVNQAQLKTANTEDEGGKEMGLVHAPVTSLHPTSAKQTNDQESKAQPVFITDPNVQLNHYLPEAGHVEFDYPFDELEIGQGFFIETETTTDALMAKLYKQVDQYRKQNSEIERDENGDDCMIDLAINQKKRNDDGTVQLDGGVPRLGIKSGFTPKLIGPNFVVKAVVKGDQITAGEYGQKADKDGALVIRMC